MLQHLHQPAPADAPSEADRHAYNTAFHELDLNWSWDAETYARLRPYGRAGLRSWVETMCPHLLRAYTADFLVDAIEAAKARCLARIAHAVPRATPRLAA